MKRFMTIVSVLAVVAIASNALATEPGHFGWTISSSTSDPFQNTGAPTGGPNTLYMWIGCSSGQTGAASSEFAVTGSMFWGGIAGSLPQYLFTGSQTDLLGAFGGGPGGGTMVGIINVFDFGGTLCFGPSVANARNITVGQDGKGYPNDYIGYTSDGSAPCVSADFCAPTAVELDTWGNIKSMYR